MVFRRGVEDLPGADTTLRIIEAVTPHERATFARIVRVSYRLPQAVEVPIATAPDGGWQCWLALDGDEPAGAAALFATDGAAYLGLAGTLPEHRGKGAQSALLAARIRRAAKLGSDVVVTETGELQDGRPSNSYRNILRAGFKEVGVTPKDRARLTSARRPSGLLEQQLVRSPAQRPTRFHCRATTQPGQGRPWSTMRAHSATYKPALSAPRPPFGCGMRRRQSVTRARAPGQRPAGGGPRT